MINTADPKRVSQHVWLLPGCQVVLRCSSSSRVVRTCVRPLDATHLRRGPLWRSWLQVRIRPKDSRWSAVATWFSRSRPCDRLLHKSSENSPLSASGGTPSANSVPGSASGMDDQLPLVSFLLLSATPARAAPVDSSASIGRTSGPLAPSGLPRIPLETSPDVCGHPRREGSNHSISPTLVIVATECNRDSL